tara:strand:- start:213 stop:1772 length:1560 start_codon:yes stop_codon:yes gene_type:complete
MGTGAGGDSPYGGTGAGIEIIRAGGKAKFSKPIDKKTKSITYSETTPDLLLDLSATASATVSKTGAIKAVKVKNDGYVSALASFVYNSYTAEGTIDGDASPRYVKYLLNPNEEIILPTTRAIIGDAVGEFDGTPITATAPNANEYVTSGALTTEGFADDNDTTITFDDGSAGAANNLFQVNDLIRLDDEICRVTSIVDTAADGAYTPANFIVERGVHGSTKADHTNNTAIRLPFFNAYHDYDKYSVAQSDSLGRFKANNFFGYGRSLTGQAGLTAGSIAIQFYNQGKAVLSIGDASTNLESGLTASTAYEFDIGVDGGTTFDNLTFTTDSSNTKLGGSTGVLQKIQDALDTQYYTAGNLFEKKVTVGIEGGDIVFRSGSFLSTSNIIIGAGSTGAAEFLGAGRIPAAATSHPARLEAETTPDPITNGNTYKQIFIRDDGNGNLIWKNERKVGTINYETGAIDWTITDRPNAEFVVSVLHTSPFSGKLDATTTGRLNSLRQILGNTPQQKCEAKLTITTY